MAEKPAITEGWKGLSNSKKWHYFIGGRSLCRKWMIMTTLGLEQGNDDSNDNCAACRRSLAAMKAKVK